MHYSRQRNFGRDISRIPERTHSLTWLIFRIVVTTKITHRRRNLGTVWTVSGRGDGASDKAVALPRYRILCRCWPRFSCHPYRWRCYHPRWSDWGNAWTRCRSNCRGACARCRSRAAAVISDRHRCHRNCPCLKHDCLASYPRCLDTHDARVRSFVRDQYRWLRERRFIWMAIRETNEILRHLKKSLVYYICTCILYLSLFSISFLFIYKIWC